MTIGPGALTEKKDSFTQTSLWNKYEKHLDEVKKHVDSKITRLGYKEIGFKRDTILATESNVKVQVNFHGANYQVYQANIFLKEKSGADLDVRQLTEMLVSQAKSICVTAVNSAIDRAKKITDRKIFLCEIKENDFRVACLDETTEQSKEEGDLIVVQIPKSNVITWAPGRIALEIVKSFAKGLNCEEKLESDWKVNLTTSQ